MVRVLTWNAQRRLYTRHLGQGARWGQSRSSILRERSEWYDWGETSCEDSPELTKR